MHQFISVILFVAVLLIATIQSASLTDTDDAELTHLLNRNQRVFNHEQQQFQQQMLVAHNKYRSYHRVSPLQLDDSLNSLAQNHAETLARQNQLQHSVTRAVGENLDLITTSQNTTNIDGASITDLWYDEIQFYKYADGAFSMKTGRFTQIVWKDSQKLGVGFAYNNDSTQVYIVAQYSPSGNYIGQFLRNVLAPRTEL